jgi:hypothetical protein
LLLGPFTIDFNPKQWLQLPAATAQTPKKLNDDQKFAHRINEYPTPLNLLISEHPEPRKGALGGQGIEAAFGNP